MLEVFLVLVAAAAASAVWVAVSGDRTVSKDREKAWEQAIGESDSQLGRILLSTARPLGRLPSVYGAGESRQYRALTKKLLSARVFGGSAEVFLSYQALMIIVGIAILAATLVAAEDTTTAGVGVALAVGVVALPYNTLSKAHKQRESAVLADLPEFTELLRMPLAAGIGIVEALRFTASRHDGVVSDEVQRLLKVRQTGVPDAQAFQEAGLRLGTPEAEAFFVTLLNALTGGAKTVAQITAQGEELRRIQFQNKRAEGKKLPVKMIGIMAANFMPLLFTVVMIPTAMSLGGS